MSVYNHSDYREILKNLVKTRREFEPRFGFHKLADAAKIQKPYMSKVMSKAANLSTDQLYRISLFLNLNEEEQYYVNLCLELERSGIAERRTMLKMKIESIAAQYRDSTKHISAKVLDTDSGISSMSEYYLDPLMQLVHVGLTIPKYRKNPLALAHDLHITGPQMHTIISTLEKCNLIERKNDQFMQKEITVHLPKTSPLYKTWRNQVKLASMQKLNSLPIDNKTYSFSTVFSSTETTRKNIHTKFLDFLKECEKDVRTGEPKHLYQMSFDLFCWAQGEL